MTFVTPAAWLRRLKVYQYGARIYGTPDSITGPLILAAILKQAGHHVEAYEELNGSVPYDELIEKTDVLCLYTMTSNAPRAYQIADAFHERGHARVLIGGIHASAVPEEALAHADQVMVGEGESTILDVVEGRLSDPIVYAQPVCDLDSVPWPDYSVLKTPVKAADIMTSRGCPFRCSFCTTSRMFDPYRKRSVDSVIAEIRHYHELGFEYMNFEDDNFTADKERAKEICRRIIDEHLQFKETFFFGRTDMADDPELLDLLAAANLNWVLIGIESLNQESLDAVDKHQSVEDIRRAGRACRDHGIQLIASIVVGIDTDTHEDIMHAVDFAKEIDASKLQPAILTPYPGTPVYEQYMREGRMLNDQESDWQYFDMMNATFQPKHMSPWDLEMEFYRAANRFYDRKSAFRMGRLFGWRDGVTRYVLGMLARLGKAATWEAGVLAPNSWYGRLRHAPWMYGGAAEARRQARQDVLDPLIRVAQAAAVVLVPLGLHRLRHAK
ncbi:MAG: B12-binding domain-containing radical SAM protein [Eggerthellaceae bacterium]